MLELELGELLEPELELGELDESELLDPELLELGEDVLPEAPELEPCFAK